MKRQCRRLYSNVSAVVEVGGVTPTKESGKSQTSIVLNRFLIWNDKSLRSGEAGDEVWNPKGPQAKCLKEDGNRQSMSPGIREGQAGHIA